MYNISKRDDLIKDCQQLENEIIANHEKIKQIPEIIEKMTDMLNENKDF
jgi:hypothetical protein